MIPTRNRWELTAACLKSLSAETYPELRIIVVDDGSTDGTQSQLREHFPDVTVLPGDGSLWWTGATALGIEWVLERCAPGDYVLTLNNDTVVDPSYVETLVLDADRAGGRALVGSVAVDIRDRDTIADGGPFIRWRTAKNGSLNVGESLAALRASGMNETYPDVLPGRGTLIPVSCIRQIGNFDVVRLPHYAADYEFSARAARAGYRLVMSYRAPVFSVVDATGTTTKRGRLPWRQFFGMFFSRRSPACLLYRWRFGRLAAPRGQKALFVLADTARVLGGGLRDQLGSGGRAK